ncbi:MAG: Eco57I restriction-modification methylase domain-containing protein, partial [Thermoanaerobaculia bacterium]
MTDDAYLFHKAQDAQQLPLYEGKMIWQFDAFYSAARFFVEEKEARKALLRALPDTGQPLEYQRYRLAYRDVSASTNERTMIATLLPPSVFTGNTLVMCSSLSPMELLYLVAVMDSFTFDWLIRKKVSAHCNMFYVYQMPVPRLMPGNPAFEQIALRSARLICTRPEFDDLAREAGISRDERSTAPEIRATTRAEVDAIVAHVYGLTEADLQHMLAAFPLVAEDVKTRVLETFRTWKPASDDP